MFSTNFSTQVKQSIIIKKTKISEYGSKGEMKPSGVKTKLYRVLSMQKSKYLTITTLDIDWLPTAPHLMEGAFISVKIKDQRASGNAGLGDLIYLRKPASTRWRVHIELSLSTPVVEMLKNPPLSFDIDIQSVSMKSGVEIGELKISSFISATSEVSNVVVKSATYNVQDNPTTTEDYMIWKGMPRLEIPEKSTRITALVGDYLNGNMNMDTLSKMMCSILV